MRGKLEQKMAAFLDQKLDSNGLFQHALESKDARAIFRLAAQACVGIREVGGNNRGPMVELIQETIGKAERESWCMSFVQTCLAYAEFKTGVASTIPVSEHCLTVWNQAPTSLIVQHLPLAGAIAIWRHGTSSSGHCGIVDSCDRNSFWAFEGNTEGGINPGGKVERDGGGVYHTHRSLQAAGEMHLMGFLKPFESKVALAVA